MIPIACTLTGIAFLFLCGFWAAALLMQNRSQPEFLISVPIFGMVVSVLWICNLNYLGVPAKFSTLAIVIVSLIADVALLKRGRPKADPNWPTWGIIAACTFLFVLPHAIHGGFPAFNDAVYYSAVADFVRDHSYFASAEPADTYPWLSQMLLAQINGGRMGAQYFLAALSALTGADGFSAFMPATACGLFVSFCGFWLLARTILSGKRAPAAALAIYGTNIAFVQQAASLNWLSQQIAFGPMYALIAYGLTIHPFTWRDLITGALLIAGLVSIYPEILPFTAVPLVIFVAILLIQRRQSWSSLVAFWLAAIAGAFLLNPYTWFYTLRSLLIEFHGTWLGFGFMQLSWWPMDLYFGLVPTVGYNRQWLVMAARIFGGVLFFVALAGLWRLRRDYRIVVAGSGLIYAALAMQQLYLRHFLYAFHKLLVYSYYLLPLCAGCGLALLLARPTSPAARRSGAVICAVWLLFGSLAAYYFVATCYYWMPWPRPPERLSPAQTMAALVDLRSIGVIPKQGERTLILCPFDQLDRWIPYFFRKPVGDVFKSGYFSIIFGRPLAPAETFDYYLTLRSRTSWKDESGVLFENPLFSFSKAQTTMLTTNEGWYDPEAIGPGYAHWMGKKGASVIIAPAADLISIESNVGNRPDGKLQHLRVTMNGKPAGTFTIDRPETRLAINNLKVQPGLNHLVFETDEEPRQFGSTDSRALSLRFERLRIKADAPSTLNVFKPIDAGFVEGLTPDRWITGDGVRVKFRRPRNSTPVLEVSGEAFNATVPGAIQVLADGSPPVRIPIVKGGLFTGSAAIQADSNESDLVVTIKTEHTFRPSDSKTSTDTRNLGFRLEWLRLRGQ